MLVTKVFEITLDEPCPHWLCADNLSIALHGYCTKTRFDVVEIGSAYDPKVYINFEGIRKLKLGKQLSGGGC
jgi:hypothetical protein